MSRLVSSSAVTMTRRISWYLTTARQFGYVCELSVPSSRLAMSRRTAAAVVDFRTNRIHVPMDPRRNRAMLFSSSSSKTPPIEVTQTPSNTADETEEVGDRPDMPDRPQLAKSYDQSTEERILSLQSEVRSQHRLAAYSSALATSQKLLDACREHFGRLHPATASAHNNVGLMQKCLGNYAEAKEAYSESLSIYGDVVGKDHASYAAALNNLGTLERGRALQSELEEAEQGVDADADHKPNDQPKLSALERMQLNESAIEYFDESLRIRMAELGPHHPHTVLSRSSLGSAMAAAVLAERNTRLKTLLQSELRNLSLPQHKSAAAADKHQTEQMLQSALLTAASKLQLGSSSTSKLTRRRWEAAEEHLREAFNSSVDNPRGETVSPLVYLPQPNHPNDAPTASTGQNVTHALPPFKKDRSASKKDRRKAAKQYKRDKRRANINLLSSKHQDHNNQHDNLHRIPLQGAASKVITLSSATAAQNLAVFLKNYADWMRLSLLDPSTGAITTTTTTVSSSSSSSSIPTDQDKTRTKINQIIQEAHHLYEAALNVRTTILPSHHPEVISTKFSLAELLEFSISAMHGSESDTNSETKTMMMESRAKLLREEILDAYDVTESEEDVVTTSMN